MKIPDFISGLFAKAKIGSSQNGTIVIDIPPGLYYKELALYTAYSYIGNAISMCEMKVFRKGKAVRDNDYYRLNIAPNKNENANLFWHKVVREMVRSEKGAMVVEINGELHCVRDFTLLEERPILGNVYNGIILDGGVQLDRLFYWHEVYIFKMEDESVKRLIDGIYSDYGKVIQSAARAFKDTNGRKFKFKVDAVKAGDENFESDFKEVIAKNIKDYMENEYSTYVEYEGEELKEESNNVPAKSSEDFIKLRKDMFDIVGDAFKIPSTLMSGNVTSLKDVCDVFLTFSIDPVACTITKVLNKRATRGEFLKGNYYKCYTGRIKHRDLFDSAPNADKLIASSVLNQDEVRVELEQEELNTETSKQYVRTKNYARIEDTVNVLEGGEGKNE